MKNNIKFVYLIIIISIFYLIFQWKTFWYQLLINNKIDWHNVKVIKIFLDNNTRVITSVSTKWETLKSLTDKVWWVSAINWAYFMPKDYWFNNDDTNAPRFYKGKMYSKYGKDFSMNWVFSFDKKWKPFLVMNNL